MKYIVYHFQFSDTEEFVSDVLAAELAEIGFESFLETETGLDAFVQSSQEDRDAISALISNFIFEVEISFLREELENKNWNEEWEKYFFEPILIGNKCVIHSSFHKDFPQVEYDITIDPKMAFGTGHHETTSLMVNEILQMDYNEKTVLDMGCGTSVLAILASMRGAKQITAIDIDEWCTENSIENIEKNNRKNIDVFLGDVSLLKGQKFDVILANINRNILLQDMEEYSKSLVENGVLFVSGFYTEDIPQIEKKANECGLNMLFSKEKNNWAVVKFIKSV